MNINYHKWLECEVTHSYFQDGMSSIFNMVPFEDSARQMANYNILLNRQRNSISFYIGIKDEASMDIAQHLNGITDLYFQLIADDVTFFNFTQLKPNSEEKIYFLSNVSSPNNTLTMHAADFVSETELVLIRPNRFNYTIPMGESKIEVKTKDGEVLLSQEFSNEQRMNYLVDLNHRDPGIYQLWVNSQLEQTFFMNSQSIDPGSIGIVQINMASLISNLADNLKYSINFESRSVFWRYKVVVSPNRNIELIEMNITGIDSETYNGPEEQEFMGNQIANIFTSDVPMPLQHKLEKNPVLNLSYTSESTDRGEKTIQLPNPGVESITMNNNEENEQSFYSTSIIYV